MVLLLIVLLFLSVCCLRLVFVVLFPREVILIVLELYREGDFDFSVGYNDEELSPVPTTVEHDELNLLLIEDDMLILTDFKHTITTGRFNYQHYLPFIVDVHLTRELVTAVILLPDEVILHHLAGVCKARTCVVVRTYPTDELLACVSHCLLLPFLFWFRFSQ